MAQPCTELVETLKNFYYSQTLHIGHPLNPLSPNIHIQILQAVLYTFP